MEKLTIMVPTEMQTAFEVSLKDRRIYLPGKVSEHALEAALFWLKGKVERLHRDSSVLNDPIGMYRSIGSVDLYRDDGYNDALRDVLGIFSSPFYSHAAEQVMQGLRGLTLTPEEADAIVEELKHTAHGWYPN